MQEDAENEANRFYNSEELLVSLKNSVHQFSQEVNKYIENTNQYSQNYESMSQDFGKLSLLKCQNTDSLQSLSKQSNHQFS